MATVMRDLWPDDIKCEDVISPEEILEHQANRLEARTNGVLVAHVVRLVGDDRVVIGFEVESPRAATRVRLFEVQRRLEFEYPAAIVPPEESIPEFLQARVYRPGPGDVLSAESLASAASLMEKFRRGEYVENKWVASSPTEFSKMVEEVLAMPAVKALVFSLLSRSRREGAGNEKNGDES
jgi:hypothetical protein